MLLIVLIKTNRKLRIKWFYSLVFQKNGFEMKVSIKHIISVISIVSNETQGDDAWISLSLSIILIFIICLFFFFFQNFLKKNDGSIITKAKIHDLPKKN